LGRYGCRGAKITIRDPAVDFQLLCGVTGSCQDMELLIVYTPPAGQLQSDCRSTSRAAMGTLQCVGVGSCVGMHLTVINAGCDRVEVAKVECREGSCGGAVFDFQGAVDILECALSASGAQPQGLSVCSTNLRALICPDTGSCINDRRVITDPANGFTVQCLREHSCRSASYTVALTAAKQDVESMRIECSAVNSCMGTQLAVYNQQSNALTVTLTVECLAQNACTGANFAVGEHVDVVMVCEEPRFCEMCFQNGMPCHRAV